ncbi:hypothetical protein [Escherichia coli]|uniref:hypothetical protein n=1 Tax=Escherichia coli TaxID=562 RepID=UPI0012FFF0B3|nr:hypothetical protein [Escherichia coli]
MPDATLAASYPAYGIAHVGRIRRSRRIRQWRGAIAGCATLAASYLAFGIAHVGRIRRSRRIRQ